MGFLKEGNMLIRHESGLNNGLYKCLQEILFFGRKQVLTELGTGMAKQRK